MRALPILLLLGWAGTAGAAPSQLNVVPTADVVPTRQLAVQVQNGNTALRGADRAFAQPEPAFQTEFGLLPGRVEGGLDLVVATSPSDYRAIMNLKAVPVAESYTLPALAVGVEQVGRGFAPIYFAVASRTLNYQQIQYQKFRAHHRNIKLHGVRLHGGAWGTPADPRGMLGTDIECSEHFLLYADWISGRDQSATLGSVWVVDQQNSVQVSLLDSNNERRLDGLQLAATHLFRW